MGSLAWPLASLGLLFMACAGPSVRNNERYLSLDLIPRSHVFVFVRPVENLSDTAAAISSLSGAKGPFGIKERFRSGLTSIAGQAVEGAEMETLVKRFMPDLCDLEPARRMLPEPLAPSLSSGPRLIMFVRYRVAFSVSPGIGAAVHGAGPSYDSADEVRCDWAIVLPGGAVAWAGMSGFERISSERGAQGFVDHALGELSHLRGRQAGASSP